MVTVTSNRPGRPVATPTYKPGSVPRGGGTPTARQGRPLPPGQLPIAPTRTTSGQPVTVTPEGYISAGGRLSGGGGAFIQRSGNYQTMSGEVQQVDYQIKPTAQQSSARFISGTKVPETPMTAALARGGAFGAVGGASTPEGTAYQYPVFGTGYRRDNKTPYQEGLSALGKTEDYVRESTATSVRGTGQKVARYVGESGLGSVLPVLKSERVQRFVGSKIDNQLGSAFIVPKGISFAGAVVQRGGDESSFQFQRVEYVGGLIEGSRVRERGRVSDLAVGTIGRVTSRVGRTGFFGSEVVAGAGEFAYVNPVQTGGGVVLSEMAGAGVAFAATRGIVNPLARRAASRFAPGSIEGLNAAFTSSQRSQAVIGALGIGGLLYVERNKSPRELGGDFLFIAPGTFGAARGARSGIGARARVTPVGEPQIRVPFSSGTGLRTRVRSYRTDEFRFDYSAFPGFRSKVKPVRASETLSRRTFMTLGGRATGETIPLRFVSFTDQPTARLSRGVGYESFKGRYNVRSEEFEFFRLSRSGKPVELYRSSFTGRSENDVVSGFSTTDVFGIRGGRRSYIGSDIVKSSIAYRYEDVGSFYRGVGTESKPIRFRSQLPKGTASPSGLGRRGQVAIGRGPFSDSFTDFAGTGFESPPIEVTRLSPFSRAGFRGSRVGFPSFGVTAPSVGSSSLPLSLGVGGVGLFGSSRAGVVSSVLSPFGVASVPLAKPSVFTTPQTLIGATPVPSTTPVTITGSVPDYGFFGGSTTGPTPTPGPSSPPIDIPPFVGLPGFGVPIFGVGRGRGVEGRGRGRKFRYAPSFNAFLFGIKGKRPTGPLSGFETRPIIGGGR